MSGPILLNDIKRRGVTPLSDNAQAKEWISLFFATAQFAKNVVADNVSRWYVDTKDGEIDPFRDIPCIVPPFPVTWIEWTSFSKGDSAQEGMLIVSVDFGKDEDGGTASVLGRINGALKDKHMIDGAGDSTSPRNGQTLRWLLHGFEFIRLKNGEVIGPMMSLVALTPEGGIGSDSNGKTLNFDFAPAGSSEIDINFFAGKMNPGYLTLAFLNCKNVVTTEHLPSRQERRLAERKGEPITRFHTLSIEPMKKVLQSEGGIATNGLKKALHICRGHFSHYTEKKPLFGKYSGQFWIPAHVRGSADAGQVNKDYDVKPPKGEWPNA